MNQELGKYYFMCVFKATNKQQCSLLSSFFLISAYLLCFNLQYLYVDALKLGDMCKVWLLILLLLVALHSFQLSLNENKYL